MSNEEILEALKGIAREKAVDRRLLVETLTTGLLSAAKRRYATAVDVQVNFDEVTGQIHVIVQKKVAAVAIDLGGEIDLEEARKISPRARAGDVVGVEVPIEEFGRNAIQTAKQVLVQRVREAERENVFNEYIDRKGTILSGTVQQIDRGNVIVKVGKTEGVIPHREQINRDRFKIGDPLRAYVLDVDKEQKGPQILLSRTHPEFVRKLFEQEVPEIFERVVEIKAISREPGSRTKICVVSHDDRVDPVGACVGMKGSRVQNIVKELGGERIDIVSYSADPKILASRALSPARVLDVIYDDAAKKATVVVADDQVPLAIGRGGQNARLAAKLTGLQIVLVSLSQVEAQKEGEAGLPNIDLESLTKELGPKLVEKLMKAGKETLQDVMKTSIEELMEIPGVGEKTASRLLATGAQILEDRALDLKKSGAETADGEIEETQPLMAEEDAVAEDGQSEEQASEAVAEAVPAEDESGSAADESAASDVVAGEEETREAGA
ncbi:MAG: transcription termination/antitermination protein NusA [Candidatus Eisenbacteria bacterium]|nr:transcription termination/antitermination protein NusA [Candidatus Eisenbacteria bacterium]